jgi:hypothetical protein
MDMGSKCGKMAQSTTGNGKEIKQTGKESSYMLTEIYMRVNGSVIKLMGMGHTSTQTGLFMSATGAKINNMEKV